MPNSPSNHDGHLAMLNQKYPWRNATFLVPLCFLMLSGQTMAAPNLYQTLEDLEKYHFLRLEVGSSGNPSMQAPHDINFEPLKQNFLICDANLTKPIGTAIPQKRTHVSERRYTGTVKWNGKRQGPVHYAILSEQSQEFFELIGSFNREGRKIIANAIAARFEKVKINPAQSGVLWMPGKEINPALDFRYGLRAYDFEQVELILALPETVKPTAQPISLEGFIPFQSNYPWLNRIGFGLTYTQVDRYQVNFQSAAQARLTANASTEHSQFSILFAPRFQSPYPNKTWISLAVLNRQVTKVKANDGAAVGTYTIEREGMVASLGFQYIWFNTIRAAYQYTPVLDMQLKLKTNQSDVLTQESGKARQGSHTVNVGLQYAWLPKHLYVFYLDGGYEFKTSEHQIGTRQIKDSQKHWMVTLGISTSLNL